MPLHSHLTEQCSVKNCLNHVNTCFFSICSSIQLLLNLKRCLLRYLRCLHKKFNLAPLCPPPLIWPELKLDSKTSWLDKERCGRYDVINATEKMNIFRLVTSPFHHWASIWHASPQVPHEQAMIALQEMALFNS